MSAASTVASQMKAVEAHVSAQKAHSDVPSEKDIELFQNLFLEGNEKERSFITKKMKGVVNWIDRMASLQRTQAEASDIESKLSAKSSLFLDGDLPGPKDVAAFNALLGEENSAVHRWVKHMASFSPEEQKAFVAEANTKDAISFLNKV